jgi:hypothetical protein
VTFVPRALTFRGRIRVNGPVENVFPLFSPLGEKSWVLGWDPELLHPPGASWVEGLIFRTVEESGPGIWVVSQLSKSSHQVTYYRVEPTLYVARIDVSCQEVSPALTDVSTVYGFVGLSEEGNQRIGGMTEAEYSAKMGRWSSWLERYVATGTGGSMQRQPKPNRPPHTRVQRTRSCASRRSSPLTRHPSGGPKG